MTHRITVLPCCQIYEAEHGENLLSFLRTAGLSPDAPCGGRGTCGKCTVLIDGQRVLACQTRILRDMTVSVPQASPMRILTRGIQSRLRPDPLQAGALLAFDIGTTTVAGCLLDGVTGAELAVASLPNPQASFGADVISRIQAALSGHLAELTDSIQTALGSMTRQLCGEAGIAVTEIGVVSVVGNPAMQQLFLGISPDNLTRIPFSPVLTKTEVLNAAPYLDCCPNAVMPVVPDVSGYVGADTVACVLATNMHRESPITLMVDIGTNGEMVLGNRDRMAACSTAAGPALEGANIRFGMRGQSGAIDHVRLENGAFHCSVIGGGEARGICGSGLIDAVAAALDAGLINHRGRIQNETHIISLTDRIHLTQQDIREVQLAKGAIAAGIALLSDHLGISLEQIDRVYLAGAFGTFLDPDSACRIGLLPAALKGRITAVGNAALSGARQIACSTEAFACTGKLASQIEFLELAPLPDFQRSFARHMRF